MVRNPSHDLVRALVALLATIVLALGTASAQDDAGGEPPGDAGAGDAAAPEAAGEPTGPVLEEGEVLAAFYSELPTPGAEPILVSDVGQRIELDETEGATHVVVTAGERAYLFEVAEAGTGQGDVRLDVTGEVIPGESRDDAEATSPDAPRLVDVAATLLLGVQGEEDLLLVATTEQNGVHVVRFLAPRASLTSETPVEVGESSVVVTLRNGVSTTLETEGAAATAGEISLRGGSGVLDDAAWESGEEAPPDGAGVGIGSDPAAD